jgi:formamidopyrimidine-DNA glycosylase
MLILNILNINMPELSEISYMTDNIQFAKNQTLEDIIISKFSKYKKKEPKNFNELKKDLPAKIKDIYNIGKRIFIILENEFNLFLNMGMSGELVNYKDEKYNSIEFKLKNGKSFYFNDVRKFGTIRIDKHLEKYEKELGYDPIHEDISFEEFFQKYIKKKKSKQSLALKMLDQKIFAGLGNYLRAEILYDTKIDPFCEFNKVPKDYWEKIYISYKKISKKSYDSQTGKSYSQFSFQAYQRDDKNGIVSKKVNGRTLWYDPSRIKYKC